MCCGYWVFDIINNSGKKKLFTSNLYPQWKREGSGEHESAGHRANGFENYFGFGFQLMHIHRDSSTHGTRGIMKEALPSKIVKAHRGSRPAPALPEHQKRHSVARKKAQE